ncbi:MAG: NTPase [Deltaproteobacteria bacterium]|nr:NTPase [Deltaproteobacteria bacterium]
MKAFLTGRPGVGKTTLVKHFVRAYKHLVLGFWTEELRDNHTQKRKGFYILTTEGEKILFSGKDISSPFRVGKYGVDIETFEEVVLPLLENGVKDEGKLIVIDEIGKMELLSKKFVKIVEKIVFERKNPVLGTIPVFNVHPLVSKIRDSNKVKVFLVDNRTREKILRDIVEFFKTSSVFL